MYAEDLLRRAEESCRKAEKQLSEVAPDYAKVLSELLESIELGVKSMISFLYKDGKFPKKWRKHEFDEKLIAEIREKVKLPEDWWDRDRFSYFLYRTKFWSTFYEISKYGNQETMEGPQKFIGKRDVEHALEDAREILSSVKGLREFLISKGEV